MLSPALQQYFVAGSPPQAMPAQFCGHTRTVGQGPPGGALDMYTQKHTDQVNSVLTTVATDVYTCTSIVQLPIFCATKYLFSEGGLTGIVKSGITTYN